MSRELKFRVWDNVSDMYTFTIKDLQSNKIQFSSECPVMQYTGLKDKNGTEIYEGDIVKRTTFNYDYDDIDNPTAKKYVEQISFIEYRNNGFWVNMENFGWEGENLWNWDLMEVMGNIYQNAELLTKAQIQ